MYHLLKPNQHIKSDLRYAAAVYVKRYALKI